MFVVSISEIDRYKSRKNLTDLSPEFNMHLTNPCSKTYGRITSLHFRHDGIYHIICRRSTQMTRSEYIAPIRTMRFVICKKQAYLHALQWHRHYLNQMMVTAHWQ